MPSKRPLLVCLTATRNYGWVTGAFLKANSQWADYIIVVDQMSTDNTRQLCSAYDNVSLIENEDLTYSETTRSKMALNRAREIKGDKILIYLAIDEVLPANWMDTEDGQNILHSAPGDMYLLNWANLLPDKEHNKASGEDNMYRIFHDDGLSAYDNQGRDMHTHCLPWCNTGREHRVSDFPILHFGLYNTAFQQVKQWYYYQMVDYDKNHRSVINLSRFYRKDLPGYIPSEDRENNPEWFWADFDLFSLVDLTVEPFLWDEIHRLIEQNGANHYRKLDIWDKGFLSKLGMANPRNIWHRMIHSYLHATQSTRDSFIIRALDKMLKRIV